MSRAELFRTFRIRIRVGRPPARPRIKESYCNGKNEITDRFDRSVHSSSMLVGKQTDGNINHDGGRMSGLNRGVLVAPEPGGAEVAPRCKNHTDVYTMVRRPQGKPLIRKAHTPVYFFIISPRSPSSRSCAGANRVSRQCGRPNVFMTSLAQRKEIGKSGTESSLFDKNLSCRLRYLSSPHRMTIGHVFPRCTTSLGKVELY